MRRAAIILFAVVLWSGSIHAQGITAEQYAADCRAYVTDGNEIAARGACEGALQLDPTLDDASRLIAQLDLRAGDIPAARTRLEAIQSVRPHSDTLVLLAGVAVVEKQPTLLEQYLTRIAQLPPPTNPHAVPYLQVQLHLLRGEYTDAVHDMLHELSMSGEAFDDIILTELELLLRMRRFTSATEHLGELPVPSAPASVAYFDLLAARLAWATGDLTAARTYYESSLAVPGMGVAHEVFTPEHEYAFVLLGQGELKEAYEAWLKAESRAHGRWWLQTVSVAWFILIFLFIGITIVAESSIPQTFGRYAPTERQVLWNAGGSLIIVGIGTIVGITGVFATSAVFFGSWIALLAPPNLMLLRMLFITYALFTTGIIALVLLQRYTRSAMHELVGPGIRWADLFWGGIVIAAVTLAWEYFVVPRFNVVDVPFEMFAPIPIIVLFCVALVFGELFFRGYVVPTFQLRYPAVTAVVMSALMYGFVFGAPLIPVVPLTAFLSWLYTRNRSGLTMALTMAFGLSLLFIAASVMPQLRTLFF